MYVCMYVCMYVFIKLHITAQSGPVIYSFYAVCFGTIGEEDLLGNRWAHRWIQQTSEQY